MAETDYTGETLDGRYSISRLLGRGGMGSVYQGRHTVIGKQVAVKFLRGEFANSEEMVKRFYREAQAAAAIGHRNIIDVMDVGVSAQGEPFLVMEYLEGESLSTMLSRTGPLDLAAACGILEPVLQALSAAHDKGIVHRDLKPENIFLVRQQSGAPIVKLIDFGISKITRTGDHTRLTQTGSLLGTPAYMAPEQAKGVDIDARTDVYAIGVLLYEMLTGELPFGGDNYNQLLLAVMTEPPRPPSEANPGSPDVAEELVLRLLAKDPADRPQGALATLAELKKLAGFADRQQRLTQIAAGITKTTIAGGDLGGTLEETADSQVASDMLSDLARRGTPGAWAGTAVERPRSRGLLYGVIGASVVAVVAAVTVTVSLGIVGGREQSEPASAANMSPAAAVAIEALAPGDEGVLIEVNGAPEGAKIYYNDSLIPVNPFRAPTGQTIVPLRIEAEGYSPYKVSVIPSEDRVIEAELSKVEAATLPDPEQIAESVSEAVKKVKKAVKKVGSAAKALEGKKPEPEKTKPKKAEPVKTEPKAEKKPGKKKLSKGGRGTEIAEDFE
jgi:serine/threonine-protein kinase